MNSFLPSLNCVVLFSKRYILKMLLQNWGRKARRFFKQSQDIYFIVFFCIFITRCPSLPIKMCISRIKSPKQRLFNWIEKLSAPPKALLLKRGGEHGSSWRRNSPSWIASQDKKLLQSILRWKMWKSRCLKRRTTIFRIKLRTIMLI